MYNTANMAKLAEISEDAYLLILEHKAGLEQRLVKTVSIKDALDDLLKIR